MKKLLPIFIVTFFAISFAFPSSAAGQFSDIPKTTATSVAVIADRPLPGKPYFPDIANHWAKDFIEILAKRNIINGYANGNFGPNDPVTRAQLVKIALNAFDHSISDFTEKPFKDVDTDEWFAPFIATAKLEKLLSGYSDGSFRPNQVVNRAEGLKMIMSAAGMVPNAADRADFSDVDQTVWYAPYVNTAVTKGIIQGREPRFFDPLASLSRAEVAKIVVNMVELRSNIQNSIKQPNIQCNRAPCPDTDPLFINDTKTFKQAYELLLKEFITDRGLDKNVFSIEIISQESGEDEFENKRYTITEAKALYRGVPIYDADLFLEWEDDGENVTTEGSFPAFKNFVDIQPQLSEIEAIAIVEKNPEAIVGKDVELVIFPAPQQEEKGKPGTYEGVLAYSISLTVRNNEFNRLQSSLIATHEPQEFRHPHFIVNAMNGDILLSIPNTVIVD